MCMGMKMEKEGGGGGWVQGHLLHGILCERLPVPHGHIHIGRLPSCFQLGSYGLGLLIRDSAEGGPAPNGPVALHALGCPQR